MLKLALLNCPAAQARLMQNRGMEARAVRATLNNAGRVSSEDFVLSSSQRAGDADKWAAESGSRGALCRGRKLILDLLPCVRLLPLTMSPSLKVNFSAPLGALYLTSPGDPTIPIQSHPYTYGATFVSDGLFLITRSCQPDKR